MDLNFFSLANKTLILSCGHQ